MDSQQVSSLKTILRKRKLAIKMHDPSQIIIMHRKLRTSSCSKRLSIWKDLVFRSTVVPSSFQLINLINKRKGTEIHLRRVLLLTQRTEYYKYSVLHTQHYRTHQHIGWSFLVFCCWLHNCPKKRKKRHNLLSPQISFSLLSTNLGNQ